MSRCSALLALLLIAGSALITVAGETPIPADRLAFFEKKIRPVLVEQCYKCHSAQAAQIKGGLVLDTRAGIQRGGETGEVFIAGKPNDSLLIRALRHADDAPAMPPGKQLSDEIIADFAQWIDWGAPDPRDGAAAVIRHEIDIEKGRQFWSFVPPQDSAPPEIKARDWPRTTVDRFILAGLEQRGLHPVEDVTDHGLIRRLYLDLIGLPPTVEEVEEWEEKLREEKLKAESGKLRKSGQESNQLSAFSFQLSSLVDHLLNSPHFGERWGRHWLDVARFAETSGRQINYNYPHAWRYRDWVIAALNDDKPYDQFVREQLAGDLLPAADARRRAEQLIATGFLAIGPKPHSERDPLQFQMDLADEQIDVTTQAFLGLTVACARCHDHKFDPIPQRDYYALAGVFRSTETCYGTVRIIQNLNPSPTLDLPAGCDLPSAVPPLSSSEHEDLRRRYQEVQERYDRLTKAGMSTTGTDFNLIGTLKARLANYTDAGLPKLLAMGVRDREQAADSPLYERGEIDKPGAVVPRGFVQVARRHNPSISSEQSGRLQLAEWIASADNPLTARVFVNRVWMHLFGRGIVSTPDNFGAAGAAPDHVALLDHLAVTFMREGWSIKRLIRQLVLSRTYQLAATHHAANHEADPDNVLVWRMNPRRLDAEVLRDALLSVSGRLDRTPDPGSIVALEGENNSVKLMRQLAQLDGRSLHRAVYLPVIRDGVPESLALFDFADPSLVVSQRASTTVPVQGLYLLNSPFVMAQAEAAATRLMAEEQADTARIERAYLRFFGRPPTSTERQAATEFLARYAQQLADDGVRSTLRAAATWSALCQAFVASADFLYRN